MADLGVMEMCWGLGSLSPLRDRLMAFSPAGRSASDSRDKTRRGGGPERQDGKGGERGGAKAYLHFDGGRERAEPVSSRRTDKRKRGI